MAGTKRALLIASTYKDLQGPLNDVKSMASALEAWGFKEITMCCGKDATYQGILDAWKNIIKETRSRKDTILIYYAGHGGLVEDTADAIGSSTAARYQFIVPTDYLADASSDTEHPDVGTAGLFNGILDIEMAHLLYSTTQRTRNVTTIFDCCHSGSMVRDPLRPDQVRVRSVGKVRHRDISKRVVDLRRTGALPSSSNKLNADGNTSVVRIAATLSSFAAWESSDGSGNWTGTMTRALVSALETALEKTGKDPDSTEMPSWKTLVAFVREQVQIDFPQQHAHVDGPSTRRIFSLEESRSTSFLLQINDDNEPILKAGSVSGVHKGNVYGLMPHGSEQLIKANQLGKAEVLEVKGLESLTELELFDGNFSISEVGVLAFLEDEAFPKWPVAVPKGQNKLRKSIRRSKYICAQSKDNEHNAIARFWVDGDSLGLSTKSGVKLMRQKTSDNVLTERAYDELVRAAERLARAQHLLALAPEREDKLDHAVTLTIAKVNNNKPGDLVNADKGGFVTDTDRIFILLRNEGETSLFASIFAVNVCGTVSCVHSKNASSIELKAKQTTAVGAGKWGMSFKDHKPGSEWPANSRARGIALSWPEGIDRYQPVKDDLIVILSTKHVDLGCLSSEKATQTSRGNMSSLERLALEIGTGTRRDIGRDTEEPNPFAVMQTALRLESRGLRIEELPSAEDVPGFKGFNNKPLPDTKGERGLFTGMRHAFNGTPPHVWVVNDHCEDIQVVVSKYRPNRLLSGGGINASATGVGLNVDTTTFSSPACKKTLPGKKEGEDPSTGMFPLWTRKEGFGVISILKGGDPDWHFCIENDQIPIGATAHYTGKPDLTLVEWKKGGNGVE